MYKSQQLRAADCTITNTTFPFSSFLGHLCSIQRQVVRAFLLLPHSRFLSLKSCRRRPFSAQDLNLRLGLSIREHSKVRKCLSSEEDDPRKSKFEGVGKHTAKEKMACRAPMAACVAATNYSVAYDHHATYCMFAHLLLCLLCVDLVRIINAGAK